MITIENVKGPVGGVCTYLVKVNDKEIGTFVHDQPMGLGLCLLNAAVMVMSKMCKNKDNP